MKRLLPPFFTSLLLLLASCASSPTTEAPVQSYSPTASGEQIYNLGELDQTPKPKGRRTNPLFPFELKKNGIDGNVVVRFVVDTEGKVRDIEVVQANHPDFADAAVTAVAQWKFIPGMKDGRAVNTRMRIPIGFHLHR
jgi:periplasmic protein TonB